jgi:hypothetical protein
MKTDMTDVQIIAGGPVFFGGVSLATFAAKHGIQGCIGNFSWLISWRQAFAFRKMRLASIQSEQGL